MPGVLPPLPRLRTRPAVEAPPFMFEFEYCMQVQRWQVRLSFPPHVGTTTCALPSCPGPVARACCDP